MTGATAASVSAPVFPDIPTEITSRRRRWRHALALRVAAGLRVLGPLQRNSLGILTYHRVSPDVVQDDALLNVPPPRFREQMEGLLALGYQAVPLRSAVDALAAGDPLPRRAFCVVFDDGYDDIYQHAWPVLQRYQIPATVFMATAYLDWEQPFPFDTWSAETARTRPLSTAECLAMQASDLIELGSHTHTHADFRGRPADFRADLEASVQTLGEQFGVTAPTFSFPYGFADAGQVAIAREVGVRCGLTAECGLVAPRRDPFDWPRLGGTSFDTPRTLAPKLDGWYSGSRQAFRRFRQRLSRRRLRDQGEA